jgi:hypothetical protein
MQREGDSPGQCCRHRGESILLHSDGLVEAHNRAGEMFGFPGLQQIVKGSSGSYRAELSGADVTPAEVVKILKEKFPEFQPPQNHFYPSMAGVKPGEVLLINATVGGMPVYCGVRVIYADDESFTLM